MDVYHKFYQVNNYLTANKYLPYVVFSIYLIFLIIVSGYHEPWHDEAQAWLIARDDSLYQLLTVTTHYEGHPPLWHLLLMPWAKLGLPFELSLKCINIIFAALAAGFVIFKSPLPWGLKFSIPFSYFYFYQFGVINRSYSLLLASIMLVAYYYPHRKIKPYHLVFGLSLMCATMAYGIVMAFGIVLAWLLEILSDLNIKEIVSWKSIINNIEIKALSLLFIVALICSLLIVPFSDTAYMYQVSQRNKVASFFYATVLIPGQIVCNNDFKENFKDSAVIFFVRNVHNLMQSVSESGIYGIMLLISFLLGYGYGLYFMLFLAYICCLAKCFLLFVLPLTTYILMVTFLHWNNYHAGILAGFCVFIIWQLYADKNKIDLVTNYLKSKFSSLRSFQFAQAVFYSIIAIILGINIYWSYAAARLEIANCYDISGNVANYIKKHDLSNKTFWVPPTEVDKDGKYILIGSYAINAYFDKNMIQDMDGGVKNRGYHKYQLLNKKAVYANLYFLGKPDYIIATS
jgi:hypothetical protein